MVFSKVSLKSNLVILKLSLHQFILHNLSISIKTVAILKYKFNENKINVFYR